MGLSEKSIVAEYLKISGELTEVRSLSTERRNLKDCLVLERPFILAFVCKNKQDFGKTISVLNFD
jgi:hypothetical protein